LFQNIDFEQLNIDGYFTTWDLIKLSWLLEEIFWKSMQIEFVQTGERHSRWKNILVQVRPLVQWAESWETITFPQQETVYEWLCGISWVIELYGKDIKILESSYQATMWSSSGSWHIFDAITAWRIKAVVLTDSFSTSSQWHIETLSQEKWIFCITNNPIKKSSWPELNHEKKYKIVSDGEIARIYEVE
jgi:hypothetical protein